MVTKKEFDKPRLLSRNAIRKLAKPASKAMKEKIAASRVAASTGTRGKGTSRKSSITSTVKLSTFRSSSHEVPVKRRPKRTDSRLLVSSGKIPAGLEVAPFARTRKVDKRTMNTLSQWLDLPPGALQSLSGGLNESRHAYPWSAIGRIRVWGEFEFSGLRFTIGKSGTAAMIGRNIALTASHVLPFGAKRYWGDFTPALSFAEPSEPFGTAGVNGFWGYANATDVCGYETSVICLDRPIGDSTGWFGYYYNLDDDFYEDGSFFSGGYPLAYMGTSEMSTELNIKVRDVDNDKYDSREIETDWLTNNGWSGGPLFTWVEEYGACIVGTLSGSEKDFLDPKRSVFSGGRTLYEVAEFGRNTWG